MSIEDAYAYLGASESRANSDTEAVLIPYPTEGDTPFTTETNALQEMNANGAMVGQQIGEEVIEIQFGWTMIPAAKWWEIGQFFNKTGDVIYCRFFNHQLGEWQTKQFWRQDRECNPILINDETGAPDYYAGASFVLRSTGR
jgi:hypothetical protein